MTTLQNLAKTTGKKLDRLETQAAALGFTGSVTDELPNDILAKLTGPKQLGTGGVQTNTEPKSEQTGKTPKGQGLGDIHRAAAAGSAFLSDELLEFELAAADTEGNMAANRIFLRREIAKQKRLRVLEQSRSEAVTERSQLQQTSYFDDIESLRQEALSAWAQSDKSGKSLKQAAAECRALIASFDI